MLAHARQWLATRLPLPGYHRAARRLWLTGRACYDRRFPLAALRRDPQLLALPSRLRARIDSAAGPHAYTRPRCAIAAPFIAIASTTSQTAWRSAGIAIITFDPRTASLPDPCPWTKHRVLVPLPTTAARASLHWRPICRCACRSAPGDVGAVAKRVAFRYTLVWDRRRAGDSPFGRRPARPPLPSGRSAGSLSA